MNIIVTLAGQGRRFQEAGYKQAKPLIPLPDGKPMIAHVLENVYHNPFDKIYLINRHPTELRSSPHLKRFSPTYLDLDYVTQGAACTALLAKEYINNSDSLLLVNSDQYVGDPMAIASFVDYMKENNADGGSLCFIDDNPKWSFVRVQNGCITEFREKEPISQIANVGIYYFKRGSDFVRCAEKMIHENFRVNGEFYTAPVFNYLIAEGGKVLPYMVNRMYGLGTPEDFEKNKDKIK